MIIERDVSGPVENGDFVRADIFRADDEGPVSVVMTQEPYGKGVEYKTGYAHAWNWITEKHQNLLPGSNRQFMVWETVDPKLWVLWGYVVIRIDSRGCGRSLGFQDIYSPLEIKDFYHTIEWAGTQSWSNGKVGLNGISYFGATQWLVAALQPLHLTAMIPWEGFSELHRDWFRHSGIASNTFLFEWFYKQIASCQHGNPNGYIDPWLSESATGPEILPEDQLLADWSDPMFEMLKRPLDGEWYCDQSSYFSKIKTPFLSSANWEVSVYIHEVTPKHFQELPPHRNGSKFTLGDTMKHSTLT